MGVSSCILESQSIFVPCLVQLLTECGCDILGVVPYCDLEALAQSNPALVFIDVDFVSDPPLECLRAARQLLPHALIIAYAERRDHYWFEQCYLAGATVVIDKAAREPDMRDRIREAIARQTRESLIINVSQTERRA